jgi:Tfp pilus assembly protein PilW
MKRSALRWTIPTFLALQVGLLWIQGAQLHRQNQAMMGLREDIQALTESITNNLSPASSEDDSAAVPARFQTRRVSDLKLAVLGAQEEQEAAAKELQASRDSAQKAVKDAKEVRSKLSIEENVRKAEEAKKIQAAEHVWQRWAGWGVGLVALALVLRAVIRRRG